MKIAKKNNTYIKLNFEENIGCYIYIYDCAGKCTKDFLQETEDQAELFVEEEYLIQKNDWINFNGNKNNLIVTRINIITIIDFWSLGIIHNEEIYDWANSIYLQDDYDVNDWEPITEEKDSSVTNEIIALFDNMDMNLISEIDIKPLKKFAETKIGSFSKGYTELDKYLKNRNIKTIKMKLKNIDLYKNFT